VCGLEKCNAAQWQVFLKWALQALAVWAGLQCQGTIQECCVLGFALLFLQAGELGAWGSKGAWSTDSGDDGRAAEVGLFWVL
jgi:hypothetical protein